LVRFLTQDDPQQSRRANQYFERVAERGESCLINLIVLCEMVWVLESAYRYPKAAIVDLLGRVLATSKFEIENKEVAWLALEDFKNSRADFSDCLVGRLNQRLGCDELNPSTRQLGLCPASDCFNQTLNNCASSCLGG
jgi:predicted nucleic-acid-binding protein